RQRFCGSPHAFYRKARGGRHAGRQSGPARRRCCDGRGHHPNALLRPPASGVAPQRWQENDLIGSPRRPKPDAAHRGLRHYWGAGQGVWQDYPPRGIGLGKPRRAGRDCPAIRRAVGLAALLAAHGLAEHGAGLHELAAHSGPRWRPRRVPALRNDFAPQALRCLPRKRPARGHGAHPDAHAVRYRAQAHS
nr:hypothetical protein [Tanacetum cinerariifolium]